MQVSLKAGEKVVEIADNRGLITTDIVVKAEDVRKAHLFTRYFRNRP